MLKRNIEVSTEGGPVTFMIGDIAIVLRRVGERTVSVLIDADRTVPISMSPNASRRIQRD